MRTRNEMMPPADAGPVERPVRPGAEAPTLPEPAGFRTRYRSEPGMIGRYPWTYADAGRRKGNRPECEYEDLFTADQMRAAVAAERERCAKLCEGMHPEDGPHAYAWTIRTEWAADSDGPYVGNNRI